MVQGFLVVRLARLAAQHPGLDIKVATDLHLVSLERREADIALRFERPQDGAKTEVFKCEAAPAGAKERRAA
jgi:DNA-binding transcriptional LysR family regulator